MYANAALHRCFPKRSQAAAYATTLWVHRFAMRLEGRVALFVAPSAFLHDRLLAWGIESDRVVTIRNFTNIRAEDPPRLGRHGLYLGRLSSEKGLPGLLEALRLADDPPFLVVGDGPLGPALRQLARDLGLERTEFLGRLPHHEVPQVLAAARYLVMPSQCDENAPLAALEAMASGRPLLVTRVGGLPELVEGGGGFVCERGDVAGMAAQLRRLVRDDSLCRLAGTSALRFAFRELAPGMHRRNLEAAYSRAVGGAPAGWAALRADANR
jgi:glycosyltransferase involved in cell wall biosynthesis